MRGNAKYTYIKFQKGGELMSRQTESYIKSAAAGLIAGGLAFLAVRAVSGRRSFKRMTAAKAFKMIGTMLDAF